jgi:hypothetical protein
MQTKSNNAMLLLKTNNKKINKKNKILGIIIIKIPF